MIPGGVTEPLTAGKRDEMLAMLPEAYANVSLALAAYKQIADRFQQEISVFANFPSNYLGLINEDECIEFNDGALRLIGPSGDVIEDGITAQHFTEVIGEAVENYSYTKFVYYKPLGYPEGSYRVGPLARLNIVKSDGHADGRPGTRRVQTARCRSCGELVLLSSCAVGRGTLWNREDRNILADPQILDTHVRATAGVNRLEGAGQIEAPRGTLSHHYKVDENGLITWANLVVATGHNNNAMNKGVLQAAKAYVKDGRVQRRRIEPRRGGDPHL